MKNMRPNRVSLKRIKNRHKNLLWRLFDYVNVYIHFQSYVYTPFSKNYYRVYFNILIKFDKIIHKFIMDEKYPIGSENENLQRLFY